MHSRHAKKSVSPELKRKSKRGTVKSRLYGLNGEEYKTPLRRGRRELWIYEIVDNGVVLYIGQTSEPLARWYGHHSSWLKSETAIMRLVEKCADYGVLFDAETRRIQEAAPAMNIVYNNRMPNEQAYAIWSEPGKTIAERLARMPGWTVAKAYTAFNRRMVADGLRESYP